MAKRYAGVAQFLIVYIKEAHPEEKWASHVEGVGYIPDPKTFDERAHVAGQCMADLDLSIPCLVDDMDNTVAKAYKAWPDRLYIVAERGTLVYAGSPGPFGFHPKDMEAALRMELGLPASHSSGSRSAAAP